MVGVGAIVDDKPTVSFGVDEGTFLVGSVDTPGDAGAEATHAPAMSAIRHSRVALVEGRSVTSR
jgi:hypothetical protein